MAEDLYGDSGGGNPAPEQSEEKTDQDGPTAVLPKDILMGKSFKPGEEIVLQIVRLNDDSVEVKYASEGGGDKEPAPQQEQSASPEPAGSMADMYS